MDVKAHLLSRGMDPARYNVSWDDETATFLLFNLSGQMVGYQQYRPFALKTWNNDPKQGRYFTYSKDNLAVFGLETFYYRNDVLFLTEGVFDAVKLHALGLPAVAVLANDPRKTRSWLYTLPRLVVAVCDADAAGKKLANSAQFSFAPENGKDLGDLTVEETRTLVNKYMPGLLK